MIIPPSMSTRASKLVSYVAQNPKKMVKFAAIKGAIVGTGVGIYEVSKKSSSTPANNSSNNSGSDTISTIGHSILDDTLIAGGITTLLVAGAKIRRHYHPETPPNEKHTNFSDNHESKEPLFDDSGALSAYSPDAKNSVHLRA